MIFEKSSLTHSRVGRQRLSHSLKPYQQYQAYEPTKTLPSAVQTDPEGNIFRVLVKLLLVLLKCQRDTSEPRPDIGR